MSTIDRDAAIAILDDLDEGDVTADEHAQNIVFCPVCCTTVDAVGTGILTLECNHCDQKWVMFINPDRFNEFSIN